MLSWIRKRAGSWWAKALYVGVAITFFGGFGLLSSTRVQSCIGKDPGQDPQGQGLAVVDGRSISDREFNIRYSQRYQEFMNRLREQFQDRPIPEGMVDREAIRRAVMKTLVQEKLLLREAGALGIGVSDQELREQIALIFTNGQPATFDPERYREVLKYQGLTEQDFENEIRDTLTANKVMETIRAAVTVMPEEVRERYAFDHQPVKLEYAVVAPAVVAPDALPGETAIKTYYQAHLDTYLLNETRRVNYVAWTIKDLVPAIVLTEKEISDYYNEAKD